MRFPTVAVDFVVVVIPLLYHCSGGDKAIRIFSKDRDDNNILKCSCTVDLGIHFVRFAVQKEE